LNVQNVREKSYTNLGMGSGDVPDVSSSSLLIDSLSDFPERIGGGFFIFFSWNRAQTRSQSKQDTINVVS
jgi:hypothetical protein